MRRHDGRGRTREVLDDEYTEVAPLHPLRKGHEVLFDPSLLPVAPPRELLRYAAMRCREREAVVPSLVGSPGGRKLRPLGGKATWTQ